MSDDQAAIIGIVTVSDRASRGVYEDRGGPAVHDWIDRALASPWRPEARLIPDERERIEATLIELVDQAGCCLVITTGGTGPALRDVTPEATEAVCEKSLPGFGEAMRAVSLEKVPTSILARQYAGIRGQALLINLPGNPKAIDDCLGAVFAAVPHCVTLIGGPRIETDPEVVKAFRPKGT
ncbi:MAG: molybdopterin adenylyltransferase [Acidobacteriota bacterium]